MAVDRRTDAAYRLAVERTAAKTVERSKRAGRPVSYETARQDAARRAERVRRKYEQK